MDACLDIPLILNLKIWSVIGRFPPDVTHRAECVNMAQWSCFNHMFDIPHLWRDQSAQHILRQDVQNLMGWKESGSIDWQIEGNAYTFTYRSTLLTQRSCLFHWLRTVLHLHSTEEDRWWLGLHVRERNGDKSPQQSWEEEAENALFFSFFLFLLLLFSLKVNFKFEIKCKLCFNFNLISF